MRKWRALKLALACVLATSGFLVLNSATISVTEDSEQLILRRNAFFMKDKGFLLKGITRAKPPKITLLERKALDHQKEITSHQKHPISNKNVNESHEIRRELIQENLSRLTFEPFGRLGNVMFQYAGILGVARMNRKRPVVQPSLVLTRIFHLSHVQSLVKPEKWKIIDEYSYSRYDAKFENLPQGDVYLQAYLQSYRYFENLGQAVKDEFRFLPHVLSKAEDILKSLSSETTGKTLIGVHIRRGDKLSRKETTLGENPAPVGYINNALQWMRQKYDNAVFLIASDDRGWCEKNIKESDAIVLRLASPEVHLCVLQKCSHVIMSTGTFGWWAGWLAGGDVIYYNQPVRKGSWKDGRFNASELYLPHWVGLGDKREES